MSNQIEHAIKSEIEDALTHAEWDLKGWAGADTEDKIESAVEFIIQSEEVNSELASLAERLLRIYLRVSGDEPQATDQREYNLEKSRLASSVN